MTLTERVAVFRDRSPRRFALLIAGALTTLLAIDAVRLIKARDWLTGAQWSGGALAGLLGGLLLVLIAGVLVIAYRRYPPTQWPISIAGAFVVVLLFNASHPRRSSEAVSDESTLALLIAVDALYIVGFAYVAGYWWTRKPLRSTE